MTDRLSPDQRSRLMSKVRHKDTNAERCVCSLLHARGLRFRKNVSILPGSPDIVLPKYKAVIFVHGCFWHGHEGCKKSRLPNTRMDFWAQKVAANRDRDHRKVVDLMNLGWRVAIVWQCALERADSRQTHIEELVRWICSASNQCEIPGRQTDGGLSSSGIY